MSKEQVRSQGPNHYQTLDIIPGASHNEILHAYTRAKMTFSKDSLASYSILDEDSKNAMLEEVERAFAILGNPAKRREYDIKMGFHTWVDDAVAAAGDEGAALEALTLTRRAEAPGPAPRLSSLRVAAAAEAEPMESKLRVLPKAKPLVAAAEPSLDFEANPEFEQKINECKEVDGAFLKAVRIYRRLSADQLANRCKLSASHVVAVEEEDPERLHAPVYVRGHVALISRTLGLPNPDELAKTYIARLKTLNKLPKPVF